MLFFSLLVLCLFKEWLSFNEGQKADVWALIMVSVFELMFEAVVFVG